MIYVMSFPKIIEGMCILLIVTMVGRDRLERFWGN